MGVTLDFSALDAIRGNKKTQLEGLIKINSGDRLYKCPWEETGAREPTEYQERVKGCFTQAYNFITGNAHPRTDADWARIVGSMSQYADPLTVELIYACINELEREYKAACGSNEVAE